MPRAILSALLLVAGCHWPGQPDPALRPVPADQVLDFGLLFQQNCAGCHGTDGKLGPAPPLNDPLFLSIVPGAELLHIVGEGRSGTLMPAFAREKGGPLSAAQVKVLAEGLKPRWGTSTKPEATPPYMDSEPRAARSKDMKQGKDAFARACAICHGAQGDEPKMRINDPVFLALVSDQALRRYVITGRPDLGMPDFAGARPDSDNFKPLSAQEVTEIVALLASWRRAGK